MSVTRTGRRMSVLNGTEKRQSLATSGGSKPCKDHCARVRELRCEQRRKGGHKLEREERRDKIGEK